MAYATVFGYAFTSGLRQKTTLRGSGQPILLAGQEATVFGCYFTSGVWYIVYTFSFIMSISFFGWNVEGWK